MQYNIAPSFRERPLIVMALVVASLFASGIFLVSAQNQTPQSSPRPPQGLVLGSPCFMQDSFQKKARVPCIGILSFVEGTSEYERSNLVREAGAILRFNCDSVSISGVVVPNEAAISKLFTHPEVLALLPEAPNPCGMAAR